MPQVRFSFILLVIWLEFSITPELFQGYLMVSLHILRPSPNPKKFWNNIPWNVKEQVVDIALQHPEKSPRELAWFITDTQEYYISESSVYRILKAYDLITSPAYMVSVELLLM